MQSCNRKTSWYHYSVHAQSTSLERICSKGHSFTGNDPCPICRPSYRVFTIKTKIWLYPGNAAWHFVTIPQKESKAIQERFGAFHRGWGSLRVTVTIKNTSWKTSIFRDKKREGYLLPIKADVRRKEGIYARDEIIVRIEIND